MTTAHHLPLPDEEPLDAPALRLVPAEPFDFDDAVRRLRPRLQRYAVRRLGDAHEAEELVQEALLRAYNHREQLVAEEDLSAWTTVVTGRLVIDRLRVRGRSTSVAEVPEGSRTARDTADVVVARDEARTALDALDAIPARQAALLWGREVEGRSYEELCERYGMTEPAVRSALTRARKALRKEYAARGGTLPVAGLAVLAPWLAGLGWAERLRRAAGRVTAPAALGAVGITALGGLVLAPFGAGDAPRSEATFRPAQAVVVQQQAAAVAADVPVAHGVAFTRSSLPAPDAAEPATSVPQVQRPRLPFGSPRSCVGSTSGGSGGGTLAKPAVGGGSAACDRAQRVSGSVVYLDTAVPANPLGITRVGVQSDLLDCGTVPVTAPLVKCTPSSSSGGTP